MKSIKFVGLDVHAETIAVYERGRPAKKDQLRAKHRLS
jgi:hypothetical protein